MINAIIDYERDESVAVPMSDGYVVTKCGQRRLRNSMQGWKLLVHFADQSETWILLKDIKGSHPVETAEFAKARKIDDEPASAWWETYTFRKRDVIISKIKSHIRKKN